MLQVTDAAQKKFLELIQAEGREGSGLRVVVRNGGTIGPEFGLDFVSSDDVREGDLTIDAGEFKVHLDPASAKFLEDATIDYLDDARGRGFNITAPNAGVPRPEGPLAETVQQVLDDKINPGVASHGGVVSLVAVDGGTVYLQFGGGCQGCGMIKTTLKEGVEKVLLSSVPDVKEVRDVTDHSAGTNPYYRPPS